MGRRVRCEVVQIEMVGERSRKVDSVRVTCTRCQAEQTAYGTGWKSKARCFARLRETCPLGQVNRYGETERYFQED